jgi:hypothetical protein
MKNYFVLLTRGLLFSFLGAVLYLTSVIHAQSSTCPAVVQSALSAAETACKTIGRNQACYGNITLEAEPQAANTKLLFNHPGDLAAVSDFKSLRLSSMDAAANTWGVALMKLQANLPDTLPGQNVTLVLFGDVTLKNAVANGDKSLKPMQAFYFVSGRQDAPCASAPDSGLLIQTPAGSQKVEFQVNEVHIQLGSTLYLQAQTGGQMLVTVIEGGAKVEALGGEQIVPAGARVSIALDANGAAASKPGAPEPYRGSEVQALPIALLERTITIATPLTTEQLDAQVAEAAVCTITAEKPVNLRSGPGTIYGRAGGLAANSSGHPDGQAKGTDGLTWWRLPGSRWVRSDIVEEQGGCAGLPVIQNLPPPPTPMPAPPPSNPNNSGLENYLNLNGPQACVPPVSHAGTRYHISFGRGTQTAEESDAMAASGSSSISVNGQALPVFRHRADCPADGAQGTCQPGSFGYHTEAYWTPAEAGTYTLVGTGSGITDTCVVTINP